MSDPSSDPHERLVAERDKVQRQIDILRGAGSNQYWQSGPGGGARRLIADLSLVVAELNAQIAALGEAWTP